MVFPLNSNNSNLFAEDLEWQCKPLSLPKGVKIFLQKSVSTHVDVIEIYSPPRVTLEAKQQNQKGIKPKWRVGQALDLTTGYDFKNAKTRKHVMNLIKTWKPAPFSVRFGICLHRSGIQKLSNWRRRKVLNIGNLLSRLRRSRMTTREDFFWSIQRKHGHGSTLVLIS